MSTPPIHPAAPSNTTSTPAQLSTSLHAALEREFHACAAFEQANANLAAAQQTAMLAVEAVREAKDRFILRERAMREAARAVLELRAGAELVHDKGGQ